MNPKYTFTINFPFLDQECFALVSMQILDTRQDATFHVQLLHDHLHQYIPGGEISFSCSGGLHLPQHFHQELAAELILSVTASISLHMLQCSYS